MKRYIITSALALFIGLFSFANSANAQAYFDACTGSTLQMGAYNQITQPIPYINFHIVYTGHETIETYVHNGSDGLAYYTVPFCGAANVAATFDRKGFSNSWNQNPQTAYFGQAGTQYLYFLYTGN